MSDAPSPAQTTDKGRHYTFIENTLSDPFKTATVGRAKALSATALNMEPWYRTVPSALHDSLKAANLKAWSSQNQVDKLFEQLQDVHSFAAPLLQAKLKEKYGITDDVKTTYLRLYLPKNLPWYTINLSNGVTTRTVSLLDAALHNFAKNETVDTGSEFISKPDQRGHFDVLPIRHKMTVGQFQALCRELDIGARYKAHLESVLLPGDPMAEAVMKLKVTNSQKDALAVAAQLALTTGDIQYDVYKLVLDLTKEAPQLLLNGRQMLCCDLSMMETRLTGIVLLIPAIKDSRGIRRLIAYVPHDPDHPLKEYESTDAFMSELTRQLRENKIGASSKQTYRQFFSQFVDQQQRGHFFADLDQRLSSVKWHQKEDATDQRPTWREESVTRPRLQFQHLPLTRDFWTHTYQQKLNKVLNDAREIAVSTDDTDSKARWAWWDNFKKIVSDIFNVALLIATPFVPGVGEMMMAYTVYQLTSDVIEGLVDLAEGLGLEAAEHVISVVTDVIQLTAFVAGAQIGSAFKLKLSPLVDGMKRVKLPDGRETLWHPDLLPYERSDFTLPVNSKPNEIGLHQNANHYILPLEGKVYVVEKASNETSSNTHRIKHPTRPNAYSPKLEHNGHGAWVHEAENPGDWRGETLMRRLGHRVDRFSSTQLQQIRISSGTEQPVLRRMHIEQAATSPILTDSIKRFNAYDEAQARQSDIGAGLYEASEESANAHVGLLRQTFPDMPLTLTETLLANARPAELQRMTDENRLPLRIKSLAREVNFEAANARAYAGFYRDDMMTPGTEKLALNTLQFNKDIFGDLRLEVLDGTDGETLRSSIGPEEASTVRRLIRDEQGKYEVRDGANTTLYGTSNFYESILRALPDDRRAALGYQRGQGSQLKLWIMEKSAPAAERRTVMAEPPIRPVASVETEKLVRGWPWFFEPTTPQKRVRNLYPTLSEQEATTFVEALRVKGDPEQGIDRLSEELEALRSTLQKWRQDQHPSMDSSDVVVPTNNFRDFMDNGGRHLHDRLLECFQRKSEAFGERSVHPDGGYTLDLSTDLPGPNLDRWWKDLREQPGINKYLDQVTVLNMDNVRFSPGSDGLLSDFPQIRHLSARYSGLTELPTGIGKMRLLETLRLSNNRIKLTAESAGQLRDLTRLQTLRLDGNPLVQPLDVGRMPRLKVLSLSTTGLDAWPEHLFKDGVNAKSRPRGFHLDLRGSPITNLPEVVPGSDHALIVARTRLDTKNLSIADRSRLGSYRESVGLAFEQTYDRVATDEISYWRSLPDDSQMFSASTGVGTYRVESWHDLAAEHGSEDFFKVIRKQRVSEDYKHPESRKQLTRRVWQMIEAAALDADLRRELFEMARQPETCGDAGSQLFNNMGIKILVSKARAESTSALDLETSLVKLAKQTARLEQVGKLAREEIVSQRETSQRIPPVPNYHAPDDVEIHLAYETGLAKRLDLPWQSEGLLHRSTARVDDKMIDLAYNKIIKGEEGDGLINQMLDSFENPFWEQHLQANHPTALETQKRLFESKHEQIEDLRIAQEAWARETDVTQLALRKKTLEDLAAQLGVARSEVFTGEEMSAPLYQRLISELDATRNVLARQLTREAMAKAGI